MSEIPLAHEVLQFTRCSNQVFTRIKAAARRLRRDQVWDDLDDARVVRTTKHALGARQVVIEEGRVGEDAYDTLEARGVDGISFATCPEDVDVAEARGEDEPNFLSE